MWKTAVAGFLGLLVGATMVSMGRGQTSKDVPEAIRAHSFLLVDTAGRNRGELSCRGKSTTLALFNRNERPSVWVSADDDGPSIILFDPYGCIRARLECVKNDARLCIVRQPQEVTLQMGTVQGHVGMGAYTMLGKCKCTLP